MAEFLPAADWTRRSDLAELVQALGPENTRWVGGAVRDTLLGTAVNDIDCATPLHPDDVIARLKAASIRSVPTGIDHGTVTAILPGGPVEITTLRLDVATDGRRATVAFATEWEDDAARRDFTINALYVDPITLRIFDYFGGREDLEARLVRFIGDARQRIQEDHLRILRYFRFQARFGSLLDGEAEEACADLAPTLKGLSRERVAAELLNLLALPDPFATVARMHQRGILPVVLPECETHHLRRLEQLIEREREAGVAPHPIRRLAALLPADSRVATQVGSRLRLSNAQKKRLSKIVQRPASGTDPRALAYRAGMDEAIDTLLIAGLAIAPLPQWEIPQLPIKGGDIVAAGVAAGPEVARLLKAVESHWVAENFPGPERVKEILEQLLEASSG